ncbi:MAG: hypothetical protein DSY82_02045 [Flavobacteriia bacterium]|nr:MAG: hypothetical protein DSY82_02045 [Flavobacteriia bacterium]
MFEGQERFIVSHDWITIIFLMVLILLSLAKYLYSERFDKLFTLYYSDKYYTDYSNSRPLIFNFFHGLLLFVFIFNISLLIFYLLRSYNLMETDYNFLFYLKVLLVTILFVILRYIIGVFLGVIFEKTDQQNYLTFLKINNLGLMAIYLFPLLLIINYSPYSKQKFLLTLIALVLLVFAIIRSINVLKNDRLNFNTYFYLFLYLCTLEITPFIVSYKLLVK